MKPVLSFRHRAQALLMLRKTLAGWSEQENPRESKCDASQMKGVTFALNTLGYKGDLEDAANASAGDPLESL
jgi:hypothetical protein